MRACCNCRERELSVAVAQKKQEIVATIKQKERASAAAAEATSMSDLLQNRDVIDIICADDETELNRLTKLLRSEKQEVAKAKRKQEQLQEALNTSRMQNNAQSEQVTQLQRQIQQLEHTTTQVLPHITCRLCMFLSFLN